MDESAVFLTELKRGMMEDIKTLCGDYEEKDGIIRAMADHFGVNDSSVILEAAVEVLPNGDDYPYPVVHFNLTIAKEIAEENFAKISELLNDLNVVFQTGDFPSFGSLCLYKPLKQIIYGYRMPVNVGAVEGEMENIRFFLSTVFDQLDIFVDLILYIAQGNENLTLEEYLRFLGQMRDMYDLQERAELLEKKLNELGADR